jgi:hypothetical protein
MKLLIYVVEPAWRRLQKHRVSDRDSLRILNSERDAIDRTDTLHIEGLYAFRLDLTGDAREDVVFKFRFNEPSM